MQAKAAEMGGTELHRGIAACTSLGSGGAAAPGDSSDRRHIHTAHAPPETVGCLVATADQMQSQLGSHTHPGGPWAA